MAQPETLLLFSTSLKDAVASALSGALGAAASASQADCREANAAELVALFGAPGVQLTFGCPSMGLGIACFALDVAAATSLVDVAQGGDGSGTVDLSSAETQETARGILGMLAGAVCEAIGAVTGATPGQVEELGFAAALDAPEEVLGAGQGLVATVEFTVGAASAKGFVCLPSSALDSSVSSAGPPTPSLEAAGAAGAAEGETVSMHFAPLQAGIVQHGKPSGVELIMDVPLEVSVELGRVQMLIRDILDLSTGSIVELERMAGEPVDLLVNGKKVARGEVVVIEDNFGVRITEILQGIEKAGT